MKTLELFLGANGWGGELLLAACVTVAVAVCGMVLGAVLGALIATMRISGGLAMRAAADTYTTVLRGIPDLLVIYLLYFGGSAGLSNIASLFGYEGFIGLPTFMTGVLALGIVSAAYQAEVFRGGYAAIPFGQIEAARACAMPPLGIFFRIAVPQVLRHALPGLGNVWQLILKDSALISVTGLVELMRASQVAAGSTRQPFVFYAAALFLYLLITNLSTRVFAQAENRALRPYRRT